VAGEGLSSIQFTPKKIQHLTVLPHHSLVKVVREEDAIYHHLHLMAVYVVWRYTYLFQRAWLEMMIHLNDKVFERFYIPLSFQ
jgi:hypothetical protein